MPGAGIRKLTLIVLAGVLMATGSSSASASGILRVGVQLEPPNLDPTSGAAAAIDEIVYANVFEGLTKINEDGSVSPLLATSWEISADAKEYIFQLRNNVSFHSGAPFRAHDVKFSLERAGKADSTNAQQAIFSKIQTVDVLSEYEIKITLSEPLGSFLTYLGWGDAVIVSAQTANENAAEPDGTGPFRFLYWRKGGSVALTRNDTYWGDAPALDGIKFIFIPDPTAAYAALLAGDVDGFPNFPVPELLSQVEKNENFRIDVGTGEGEIILALNNGIAPFNDIAVRRAINHAINRAPIIDGALEGYGTPIGSHFPPHHPAYVDLSGRYPFDPLLSRQLLRDAGYPDGLVVTLTLPPPAYARRAGQIVASQLEAAGIRTTIRNVEWAQWLSQVFNNKDYEMTIVSHTEPLDIDIYARPDYYFQYRNEGFQQLIAEIYQTSAPKKKNTLLRQAQRQLADDAVNVFIASSPKIAAWHKDVRGPWRNAPIQANNLTNTDIEGRAAQTFSSEPTRQVSLLLILSILAISLAGATAYFAKAGGGYIVKRLGTMALTGLLATIVIFFMLEIAPGDPAEFMMGVNANPDSLAALRTELGTNKPLPTRYFTWVSQIAMGDYGTSFTYREPVADLISERLWVSIPLAVFALVLSTVIAIPAGIIAASRRKTPIDNFIRAGSQIGIAVPNFWLALLMVSVFSIAFGWFTSGGFPGWNEGIGPALKALLLPAIALALPQAAILTQVTRTATLEVLERDFIKTAIAKGLTRSQVVWRHALRNALLPVLTIIGLQFSFLIAGSIIIENVFYLPGLGRLVFQAVEQRDLVVVRGVLIVLVFVIIFASFITDLAYAIADPRLRKQDR